MKLNSVSYFAATLFCLGNLIATQSANAEDYVTKRLSCAWKADTQKMGGPVQEIPMTLTHEQSWVYHPSSGVKAHHGLSSDWKLNGTEVSRTSNEDLFRVLLDFRTRFDMEYFGRGFPIDGVHIEMSISYINLLTLAKAFGGHYGYRDLPSARVKKGGRYDSGGYVEARVYHFDGSPITFELETTMEESLMHLELRCESQ